MTKLLLLDCDGTIRETASGEQFINHPKDQRIIPGADKALAHYLRQGWMIVGITNQGGVAAGHKSLEDALAEQRYTLGLLPLISYILFCLDFKGEWLYKVDLISHHSFFAPGDNFRKPAPGMLYWARENPPCLHQGTHFDTANLIEDCLYVGDAEEDEQAAQAANVRFMWADAWRKTYLQAI